MKKFLFILALTAISVLGFSQNQTINGNKTFTGNIEIEGTTTMAGAEEVEDIAHALSDSSTFTFGLGSNVTGDDALFVDNAVLGKFYNEQDTCVALKIRFQAYGTSASVPFKIVHAPTYLDASPTTIYSGTATTTYDSTIVFTNNKVPRDNEIWGEINGTPSGTPLHAYMDFIHAYTRY